MTTSRYDHVLSFALEHPWAITRPMLTVIAGILSRRMAGLRASEEEIQAALVNRRNLPQPVEGGPVAVIPVYGVIAPRVNLLTEMSGGTTFQTLSAQLRTAMMTKEIKTIVFDIDSPGGSLAGATEFARELLKARARKPIVAQIQYMGASGAYWIASCCTEIVAAPSAMVGSVGVFMIHEDLSKALELEGVKITHVFAGKYKVEGNETEPLSKEAAQEFQSKVDAGYSLFLNDISKGRGVPVADVRTGYGEGRVLMAQEALTAGMIDKIGTLDDTLTRVMSGPTESAAAARVTFHATFHAGGGDTTSSTSDTLQEPSRATSQDRSADAHWETETERALLELAL